MIVRDRITKHPTDKAGKNIAEQVGWQLLGDTSGGYCQATLGEGNPGEGPNTGLGHVRGSRRTTKGRDEFRKEGKLFVVQLPLVVGRAQRGQIVLGE